MSILLACRYLYLFDEAKHADCEDVLVLAGDQLYRMDYTSLINYHRAKGADVTIATTPADEDHATHLGVLSVSANIACAPGVWLCCCCSSGCLQ